MSAHVLFCRDSVRREPGGDRISRIEGWCLGTSTVQTLLLKTGEAKFEAIAHGFSRPDVRDEFSAYPNAVASGFRFAGDVESAPGIPAEICVQIRPAPALAPEWHALRVNLDTPDIQTLPLTEETRLSKAAESLAAREEITPENLEVRFRRTLLTKRGLTLRLDIINKCNLRCVMCHFSDDAVFKRPTRQFTAEQFTDLFDGLGPEVSQVALSCGDEPLTSKFLPDILRYLATKHPHVAIEFCTNAMLMRAPIRELIIETGVARLLFSIDAVTKPLLESIRVGCRYEQLVGNILALRDLKARHQSRLPEFDFNFVMMNRNIHEAPAFVRMARVLGGESIDFRHMVPIAPYFVADDVLALRPAKYNFYRKKIVETAIELGMAYYLPAAFSTAERWSSEETANVDLADFERVLADAPGANAASIIRPVKPVLHSMRSPGSVAEDFATTFCNRPFSEIMVRDQEDVLPCAWHGKTLGRLSEGKTLSDIFLGEEFAALRRNMLKPEGDPDCARCPIKTSHLATTAEG
ncbi:MAG: radical SAM protein [Chthoniobacterales bacterium]|nr:radical SAM protein [Chthoniobacterales bacterium]